MADDITVDERQFVRVAGVRVARCVRRRDGLYLQFHDKDRRRSSARGSAYPEVRLGDLVRQVVEEGVRDDDRRPFI